MIADNVGNDTLIEQLPHGWTEYRSGNRPYWHNSYTRESVWEPPTTPASAILPKQARKSKKKIPGTCWMQVITIDGLEFYFNKEQKVSVWEKPKEVEEALEKLREQEAQLKEEEEEARKKRALEEEEEPADVKRQKATDETEEEPVELTEEDLAWQLENMDPEEEDDLEQDQPTPDEELEQDNPVGATSSATAEPDREETSEPEDDTEELSTKKDAPSETSEFTEEERIERFTQLLAERDISPFSSWDQEVPKLIDDPRYTLLPSSKRMKLFNNHCRLLAEERKASKPHTKSPEEVFTSLLEDVVNEKMYWDDFRRKAKNDKRFKAFFDTKDRQRLFKDYVKRLQRGEVRTKEDAYKDLLRDTKTIVPGMRWRDAKLILQSDRRYQAIASKTLREDLFRDYLEQLE